MSEPRTVSRNFDAIGIGGGGESGRRVPATIALTLMLIALWLAIHRYMSVNGDAELYAVQAMAKVHPGLANDVFLRGATQDKYTVFSPLYAWCIERLGLRPAALALAIVFKIWLFVAAWVLARTLTNSRAAFMAVALLTITVGSYGAFGVFHFAEDWLTARSLAEALILTALAFHFGGLRALGLLIGSLALFVHPLMALPGLLLLACLWCSVTVGLAATMVGLLTTLGISLWAISGPLRPGPIAVMDPEWLDVVRERSIFLFLQDWHARDWISNARPFLSLTIAALVSNDHRIRKLCIASMLVGAAGLLVALIASTIGPVAILIQGQSWRWEWITCFVSILLLAPAAAALYRDTRCGPLCALLLIAGWTSFLSGGAYCVALALIVWSARNYIDARTALYVRWFAVALAIGITIWTLFNAWNTALRPAVDSSGEIIPLSRIRQILELETPAVILVFLLARWIVETRSLTVLASISVLLLGFAAWLLPESLKDQQQYGTVAEKLEFADWRNAIPPDSNVYVAPLHNSAAFAWFTLERPSYLTVDQSAGVVFSRAVAMEIKRRSQVLLPMLPPDWRLATASKSGAANGNRPDRASVQPLTRDRLISVCRDPELGFVIAKESVGFEFKWHHLPGDWKDWNLYDCRNVRALAPAT